MRRRLSGGDEEMCESRNAPWETAPASRCALALQHECRLSAACAMAGCLLNVYGSPLLLYTEYKNAISNFFFHLQLVEE